LISPPSHRRRAGADGSMTSQRLSMDDAVSFTMPRERSHEACPALTHQEKARRRRTRYGIMLGCLISPNFGG
jgi:hypothetical protein